MLNLNEAVCSELGALVSANDFAKGPAKGIFKKLASLDTKTLAIMHGSSFAGDCGKALTDLSSVIESILG